MPTNQTQYNKNTYHVTVLIHYRLRLDLNGRKPCNFNFAFLLVWQEVAGYLWVLTAVSKQPFNKTPPFSPKESNTEREGDCQLSQWALLCSRLRLSCSALSSVFPIPLLSNNTKKSLRVSVHQTKTLLSKQNSSCPGMNVHRDTYTVHAQK